MFIKRKLCPGCKTGKEIYELDSRDTLCPYIENCVGGRCAYYVSIRKVRLKEFLKRILNINKDL